MSVHFSKTFLHIKTWIMYAFFQATKGIKHNKQLSVGPLEQSFTYYTAERAFGHSNLGMLSFNFP